MGNPVPSEGRSTEAAGRASSVDLHRQPRHPRLGIVAPDRSKDRLGEALFLLSFLALIAGRFTLSRVGALPDVDLRSVFLYVLCFGMIVWLAGRHTNGSVRAAIRVRSGIIWFGAWCAILALSAFWALPDARLGASLLNVLFLFMFIVIALAVASRLSATQISKIWLWLMIVAAVFLALALYIGPGPQGRYAAPGGGPNVFVRYMVMGALAAFCCFQASQRMRFLIPIPFFAFGALLSGSRGGLLAALLVLILAGVPIIRRSGFKLVAVGLIVVTTTAIGVSVVLQRSRAIQSFFRERYVEQTLDQGYASGRGRISEETWHLFQQRPFVGSGLDGYYASQLVGPRDEYPHNLVLATLAETGLIGGVLLLAALIAFVLTTLKTRHLTHNALFALIIGIYLFLASMFSGDYYDSRMMWFFLGLAAIESRRTSGMDE